MTTETTTEPSDVDLLRKLWRLSLLALITDLESGESKASAMNVARQFLSDQGVSWSTLNGLEAKAGKASTVMESLSFAGMPDFGAPVRDAEFLKRMG